MKDDDDETTTFDRFLSSALREPFTTAAREFRDLIQAEEAGRLETPSAEDADRRVRKTRLRFVAEVVEQAESATTPEQRELWSLLSSNRQDEYLCRLFLPPVLGGLYGDATTTTTTNELFDDGGSSDCASGGLQESDSWDDLEEETDDDYPSENRF
jgi:hypothetical protein